ALRGAGRCRLRRGVRARRLAPKGAVSVASRPPAGGWLVAQFPAPLGWATSQCAGRHRPGGVDAVVGPAAGWWVVARAVPPPVAREVPPAPLGGGRFPSGGPPRVSGAGAP